MVYKALGQRVRGNAGCLKHQYLIASPSLYARCFRIKQQKAELALLLTEQAPVNTRNLGDEMLLTVPSSKDRKTESTSRVLPVGLAVRIPLGVNMGLIHSLIHSIIPSFLTQES